MLNFEEILELEEYKIIKEKVFRTIKKYNLISREDKILIALSGGKDSTTLAIILKDYLENKLKLKENRLMALYVDVGIKEIEKQKDMVKKLTKKLEIPLIIKKVPLLIDGIAEKEKKINICRICGIEKRYFFLKVAKEKNLNVIATGHTLNDEVETFLMNVFQNNYKAAKENFIIKVSKQLPKKIKPLYFVKTEEIKKFVKKIGLFDEIKKECPYSKQSFRNKVREFLKELEKMDKDILYKIINFQINFLNEIDNKKDYFELKKCENCGVLSNKKICSFCELLKKFKIITL